MVDLSTLEMTIFNSKTLNPNQSMLKDIQDRKDIKLLINTFYEKVRKEKKLSFIFDEVAKVDWITHLPIMYDFWESILFHTGNYKRNAMQIHVDLNEKTPLTKDHFDIWLLIFKATVDELFKGEVANNAKTRAISIATMIQIKISNRSNFV
jgi:hemoglobin